MGEVTVAQAGDEGLTFSDEYFVRNSCEKKGTAGISEGAGAYF